LTCVLDASAALSMSLADEFTDDAQRILDHVAVHGAIVPSLWHYEVANGLLSALRRGRTTEMAVAQSLTALGRLRIVEVSDQPLGVELVALARQFDLSAYDAAYLWLARTRDLRLATLDRSLARVAGEAGVALI
jgi:predicted nucleic acid-binding protein